MQDNALIDLIASRIEAASAAAGWGFIVVQKNEPTREGAPSAPAIYFEKLFDTLRGWPIIKERYRQQSDDFLHEESQLKETTFQISSLVPQNVHDLSVPTASDVVNYVAMFLSSRPTLAAWKASNVRILRVTEVRNPYFDDDKSRYEANPSFDLIVTHESKISFAIPAVDYVKGAEYPVIERIAL